MSVVIVRGITCTWPNLVPAGLGRFRFCLLCARRSSVRSAYVSNARIPWRFPTRSLSSIDAQSQLQLDESAVVVFSVPFREVPCLVAKRSCRLCRWLELSEVIAYM